MKLPDDNFFKGDFIRRYHDFIGTENESVHDVAFSRYSYESKGKLYDVNVRSTDGDVTYHVNCGFSCEPNQYHREIEKHFRL